VIKASSGLSDEEIEKMVSDAEAHKAEDAKFHELVTARNTADSMIHATRKGLEEVGDKIDDADKEKIEAAIKDLEEAMKGEDKDDIEAKTKALTDASGKMAEKLYAEQGGDAGAAAGAADAGAEQAASGGADDVVDAEFEEVDDKK
jgi:molecular chaperone DnaK